MRNLIVLGLLWAPMALAQCLDDYRVNQKWQAHALTREQLDLARSFAELGQPESGWHYLASLGDSYAALAADVIAPVPGGSGQAFHDYIHRHWVNTVGDATTRMNFTSFAQQHFRQYVEVLATGAWPDADQILNSYLGAARAHGLPQLIVFDAVWTASDYARVVSWQILNRLPASRRIRHSRICLTITREDANRSLARDFGSSVSH